ncbi:MAG: choice-of-anchor D domain-containing protein [Terriglobia bacterium]
MPHNKVQWVGALTCPVLILLMTACGGGGGGGIGADPPAAAVGLASLNPASVNFGTVSLGGQRSQAVTLTNTGSGNLTVIEADVSGPGFSISGLALPLTLPAGQSTSFNALFAPTSNGVAAGAISVIGNASNSPATALLSGAGGAPRLAATPPGLNFGNVGAGGSSMLAVTLVNSGGASVNITQSSVTGAEFSVSGLAVPLSLNAGQRITFNVTFSPKAAGNATGMVSVTSNAADPLLTIPLSGTGGTFQLAVNPASINFGTIKLGSAGIQTVTLNNTGSSIVTIIQASVTGTEFSISRISLPLTLAAGQRADFSASFAATSAGNATGSISITSNASNSPTTLPLAGTGMMLQLGANPTSLNFGNVTVGNSGSQVVTLNNSGTGSVRVSQVAPSGAGFKISGVALPLTLAAGQNTNFNVTFTPGAAGNSSGSISVVSNASNSPLAVSLAGVGVTLQLSSSPPSLSFGDVTVHQNSTLPVVLTNTGSASVTISQATVSGAAFSISGLNLPLTLGPNHNTGFNVTFAPTSDGNASGSVSVVSSAANSPLAIALSGTGVNAHFVTLSWSPSSSQNIAGYNVFRSPAANGPYTQINTALITATAYTDNEVEAGVTYYYVTSAQDNQGTQSAYSNQAQATIPSP